MGTVMRRPTGEGWGRVGGTPAAQVEGKGCGASSCGGAGLLMQGGCVASWCVGAEGAANTRWRMVAGVRRLTGVGWVRGAEGTTATAAARRPAVRHRAPVLPSTGDGWGLDGPVPHPTRLFGHCA